MSKELIGYTNKLRQNADGTITKFFRDDGVTSRPASLRQRSESQILRILPNTPNLVYETANSITMSRVEGESNLDNIITQMPECLQLSAFESVGRTLSYVHGQYRGAVTEEYIRKVIFDSASRVGRITRILDELGIESTLLLNYFCNSLNKNEIMKLGLTITHGDYWLNNIIGQIRNGAFNVSGIVDWEMGGISSPYNDFASVQMSIFDYHQQSKNSFWKGYGFRPDEGTLKYFCLRQIVVWISEDGNPNFSSDFYKPKIDLLRRTI